MTYSNAPSTAHCQRTAVVTREGRTQVVTCWLLLVQHKDRTAHWAIVDGKPFEWEGPA